MTKKKRSPNVADMLSDMARPSFQRVQLERVRVKPLPNIIEGIGKVYWSESGQRTIIPKLRRRQVYVRAHGHCEQQDCRSTENLQIHHINGDPSDHSLENLILLCGYHHGLQTANQRPYFPKSKPFGVWKDYGNG
ncbi:MAG: HNH endonuclease signature motif containing protein [Nitrososphaeria archaeon]